MAVEATYERPVQISTDTLDTSFNNNNEQRLNSSSNSDFESEFAEILNRDVPTRIENLSSVRLSSNTVVSSTNDEDRIIYNIDGTINCHDLSYSTLVILYKVLPLTYRHNEPEDLKKIQDNQNYELKQVHVNFMVDFFLFSLFEIF